MRRAGFTLIELLVVEPPWTPQLSPVMAPATVDSEPVFVYPSDPGNVLNQDSNNQDSNGDLYAGGIEMVMAAVANRTGQAGPTVADQRTATSTLVGRESAAARQFVNLSLSIGG
jgi:hypothetical protein